MMATQTGQNRYDQVDIDSTLEAAVRYSAATKTAVFVFPSASSFMISCEPAPFVNRCYRVAVGMVERVGNWVTVNENCS